MDTRQAQLDIASIFQNYRKLTKSDLGTLRSIGVSASGKLYELWVLAKLVEEYSKRGYILRFTGTSLKFKAAPGHLKLSDPHFTITDPHRSSALYRIFVDVEFQSYSTSGASVGPNDLSSHFEADIIITKSTSPRPTPMETALVVECKAHANLSKGVIREVLGTRRELSLFGHHQTPCVLPDISGKSKRLRFIPAWPPVELRLYTTDPKAKKYKLGPAYYGIDLLVASP